MFGHKSNVKSGEPVSWKGTPVTAVNRPPVLKPNQSLELKEDIYQEPKATEPETISGNPFLAKLKSDAAEKQAERDKFIQKINELSAQEKAQILRDLINGEDED